jgi:hypothetical protein
MWLMMKTRIALTDAALPTLFCVSHVSCGPILSKKDFAHLSAQVRFKNQRRRATLIQESSLCDSIIAHSYSTAFFRRLFRQYRPEADNSKTKV